MEIDYSNVHLDPYGRAICHACGKTVGSAFGIEIDPVWYWICGECMDNDWIELILMATEVDGERLSR